MFEENNAESAQGGNEGVTDARPVLNDQDLQLENCIFKFEDLCVEKELYPTDSLMLHAEISGSEAEGDLLGLHPDQSVQFNLSPNESDIAYEPLASEQLHAQNNRFKHKSIVRRSKPKKKPRSKLIWKQPKKVQKSQTKNIPKNYGKQIIKFIQNERSCVEAMLQTLEIDYDVFVNTLQAHKRSLSKIGDLQHLWTDFEYSQAFRIISNYFLRKNCLHWIFNSRIEDIHCPVKYRQRMMEGVKNPQQFFHLKEY